MNNFQVGVHNQTYCSAEFYITQFGNGFCMSSSELSTIQTTSCMKVGLSLQPIQYLTNVDTPSLLLFIEIFSCMLFSCCRQWAFVNFHAWRHPTEYQVTLLTMPRHKGNIINSFQTGYNFCCQERQFPNVWFLLNLPFRKWQSTV
jgi:hypothetical protein